MFDKKHYKNVKAHMSKVLENRPWCCTVTCPVEWAKTFIPMIKECEEDEDFEGAKATKDAIIEFLNSFGAEIPEDAKIIFENEMSIK